MLLSAVFASENPSTLIVPRTLPTAATARISPPRIDAAPARPGGAERGQSPSACASRPTLRPAAGSLSRSRSSGRSSDSAIGPISPPRSDEGSDDSLRAMTSKLAPAAMSELISRARSAELTTIKRNVTCRSWRPDERTGPQARREQPQPGPDLCAETDMFVPPFLPAYHSWSVAGGR